MSSKTENQMHAWILSGIWLRLHVRMVWKLLRKTLARRESRVFSVQNDGALKGIVVFRCSKSCLNATYTQTSKHFSFHCYDTKALI